MGLISIKIPKLITDDTLVSMKLAFYDSDLSHTQDSVPGKGHDLLQISVVNQKLSPDTS